MKSLKLAMGAMMLTLGVTAQAEHLKSLNPDYFDNSIPVGTDFYLHTNKGWQEAHPLTAEHARYGQFNVLNDLNEERIKDIVLNLGQTNPQPGSVAYKVWTIYSQAMDSTRRNELGNKPIQADLKRIENATPDQMEDIFMWMHGNYASPFFKAGPMEDMADSNRYAMYISGGGLSLGDRDYYLSDDKENVKVREAFKKLIVKQMQNAGYSKKDDNRIMKTVMKIETAIADSTWTREESRNIPAMYNPRTITELKELYPHINWDPFFIETMGTVSNTHLTLPTT